MSDDASYEDRSNDSDRSNVSESFGPSQGSKSNDSEAFPSQGSNSSDSAPPARDGSMTPENSNVSYEF